MKILRLISLLLDYPTENLIHQREQMNEFVRSEANLSQEQQEGIINFINRFDSATLLDRQSEYDALFERGRSLSLLIFEHIHGESRDRGQAMVDLMEQYKTAGLDIDAAELPDYLPLYLEFASTQENQATAWLEDIVPVLSLLAIRLEQRSSDYATLLHTLIELSGADVDFDSLREQVKDEKRDDTPKALDKVWEEEAVRFGGDAVNGGCASGIQRPTEKQRRDHEMPLQFVDASQSTSLGSEVRN